MWHKAKFSAFLLQNSVSHGLSEIILICKFGAQEYYQCKKKKKSKNKLYYLMYYFF